MGLHTSIYFDSPPSQAVLPHVKYAGFNGPARNTVLDTSNTWMVPRLLMVFHCGPAVTLPYKWKPMLEAQVVSFMAAGVSNHVHQIAPTQERTSFCQSNASGRTCTWAGTSGIIHNDTREYAEADAVTRTGMAVVRMRSVQKM